MSTAKPRQSRQTGTPSGYGSFMHSLLLSVSPTVRKPVEAASLGGRSGYAALTRDEQIAMDFFGGFLEIMHCYDKLLDIEIYISRFPYAKTRVTRPGHLRFVVEAYLNESYTLVERLRAYPKMICRRLGKRNKKLDFNGACKRAEVMVTTSLQNLTKARGAHVHQRQFSTPDLERLELYDFLRTQGGDGYYQLVGQFTYREVRKNWLKIIKTNNAELVKLLDAYFLELHPLVFSPDGNSFDHMAGQ